LLFEIIRDFGFNYNQAEAIWGLIDQASGKQFHSDLYMLVIDREDLIISIHDEIDDKVMIINSEDDNILTSGYKMKISRFDFTHIDKGLDVNIAQIDLDKIRFPLKVRSWDMGDYFYPLGMEGKKKLSDFMIDIKIPVT